MNLFWKPLEPEVQEFVKRHRRKEPYLGWITALTTGAMMAFVSMIPAVLLFAGINSWSPMKVPLWILLLPSLFGFTLWLQRSMDMETRRATLRAIIDTIATVCIALFVQYFLNHAFSDRILADGSSPHHVGNAPFWATLLVVWIFFICSEMRVEQLNRL
jgi:hypothetical protein